MICRPGLGEAQIRKHYLISQRYANSHSYVDFACAETPLMAMRQFLLNAWGQQLRLGDDDSLVLNSGSKPVLYPHPLALIESEYKTMGEWQIREFSEAVLNADFAEGFCGEDVGWIDTYYDDCRPHLRREFPRSRAKAFLWYLNEGALVTFYRRKGPGPIDILRRYWHHWDGRNLTIEPWNGGYDDLLRQLFTQIYVPNVVP